MSDRTTTRRGALGRMLLVAGGAFGLGATGGQAAFGGTPPPAAAPRKRKAQRIVLLGRDWRLHAAGTQPGQMPAAGATAAPGGTIVDRRNRPLGRFRAVPLAEANGAFHVHTFDLADGTIVGIGSGRLDDADFAIVGGTGRYAGASGTYRARQRPREVGGDGTAEFTLNLTAWEA